MRSEMKDEPCRCIEDGLPSPHQINWDTDENTVAVVTIQVDLEITDVHCRVMGTPSINMADTGS